MVYYHLDLDGSTTFPEYVDYYKEARDSFLENVFPNYPKVAVEIFELSFLINKTAKYGPLLYDVLGNLPVELCAVDNNSVKIVIRFEQDLIDQMDQILDILSIAGKWKSTRLMVNNRELSTTTGFRYFVDFLYEKNNIKGTIRGHSINEIKKKQYGVKEHRKREKISEDQIILTRDNVKEALRKVVDKYVDLYGHNKETIFYGVSEYDKVVVVEDSLVIDFRILPWYWTRRDDANFKDWDSPYIMIQELTHNDLYKFNFADFRRRFNCEHISMGFFPYHGVHYYREEIDNYDEVDRKLPELQLQKRYEEYPGETHHFVILRMEDVAGSITYGVGDTKGKVNSFILKLCKELEEKNSRSLELNGASCLLFKENREFVKAFLSWKGKKKKWRLENKFSYYYEDRQVKNDLELFSIPEKLIKAAQCGAYDDFEFGSYNKPLNRWKSEELVYNITKKLYKDYQVIYQYKPFYLSTDKGNMSYDIYICGLKIAIEYQGKQHFEPVDYFGGIENFERQQERDELKARRSKENGVRLIYVNYWEDITPDLIKQKIEEARNNTV